MSPTEDGVVRLDTQTGAMALCQRKNDTLGVRGHGR